ncbi:hypothetical protein BLA60_17775 [Actinophytocola xinjiangensis]|uniref:Acyl transferase domain-containing protein n=1 Tax=Actinophytocola xinjiangensis TaxID=485602 RepID=A0A7Z0WKQ2_9PSEU|nr:SDR family NAD(P)-dependent oxidoreductase [Actinophytocola xinjiangensis]OLF09647.1 hypothetical protein BLA60_17775 [Actinophytocola xinjiangensis]
MSEKAAHPRIAVVGIGCRLPGARDHHEFLANLVDGVDSVREVPADRWDTSALYDPDRGAANRSISKWCGVVDRPYDFDHEFFGISPREARLLDPMQRLLMEVTQQCVEDAGITAATLGAGRTCVYVGNMERDHMAELTGPEHDVESHSVLGVYDCLLANRLSQTFGLSGASVAVDAACASSLVAVHLGVQALTTGEADYVLAGGVNLNLHWWKYVGFSKARMLSPTGRCRTFDRDADGFVPGDGVGMVLLRRLDDAVRDADHVYGVIRGSAVNHGRKRTTITAPTVASQRAVVAEAIARAGVSPADITFVETHGTGTSLGDPIEVEALRQVFGPASPDTGWCTLGAVKSNIGHLEGAAGIAGLIKVLMMMSERRIVPNLHLRDLNPLIELADSPFRLALSNMDWESRSPGAPRLAGVSSFGFGGVNAHLVVEEHVAPERRPPDARPWPFLLSAASEQSLRKLVARWRHTLPDATAGDVCATLAVGRDHLPHRLGGVVTDLADIPALLAFATPTAAQDRPWALRVGLMEPPENVDGFLDEFVSVLDPDTAEVLRSAVGEPRRRCAYTTAVVSALLRFGLNPAVVVPDGAGVWPALAALGMLDPGTAAGLSSGEPGRHQELGAPSAPLAVPGTDRVVTPYRVDAAYLDRLRGATADRAGLTGLVELARKLDTQRTFQSNLADWRRALRERGRADDLSSDPDFMADPLAVALALQNALDRLNRKWDLPLARHLLDERAVELSDLLLDGVVDPGDLLDLTAGAPVAPRHPGRVELADRGRYPILRRVGRLPDDLADVGAWARLARSTEETTVMPEGHTVVVVGDVPVDPDVDLVVAPSLTETLVRLWRHGVDVRWQAHPVAGAGARTPLPTTEFNGVEHRIRPADPTTLLPERGGAASTNSAPDAAPDSARDSARDAARDSAHDSALAEHVVELRARWEATARVPVPATGPVVVLFPPGAVEVRQAAERLPGRVRAVDLGTLPADDTEAWQRALDEYGTPTAVVLTCTGSPADTVVAALHVAKASYGRGTRVFVVGRVVDGRPSPELAAIAGFARSLARETATVPFRAIAVPDDLGEQSTWDVVADELGRRDGTELVRHGPGGRLSRRYTPAALVAPTSPPQGVRPGGTYLLTGGTGGLGRMVTAHLLAVPGVRVAVVGRSADSDLDQSDRLTYFQADVSDPAAARDVIRRVRARFGALTGVLHAAGVLRDGYLAHKQSRDLRAVLAPKVLGAVNLDDATQDEPLELFVLFSSMVAVLGNPGQADYAAANAFLDQFAEAREARRAEGERSGRTLSIGWPVWRDGGMAVTERGVLSPGSGVLPMPTATALAVLNRLLSGAAGARPLFHGEPDRVPELLDPQPAGPEEEPPASDQTVAPSADPVRVVAWAKDYVAGVIGELRGIPPADVDLEMGLDRLGLDSIVIAEFNTRIEAKLGSVGETLLFESRTLAAAAERIARLRAAELTAHYGEPATSAAPSAVVATHPVPATVEPSAVADDVADGDVAIIGLAGRYPEAPDLAVFWRNLLHGRDSVTEVPSIRWTPGAETYCRRGAFLDDVDAFDPLFFGISPRDAVSMDPQERLFLQTAWHAFEDAGYPPHRLGDPDDPGARAVGVFVGVTTQTHLLWGPDQQRAGHPVVPPSPQWSVANRVSYWLDLRGPSMPVDTACASSLTAVHLAVRSIARGECDMALVGGVNLYLHPAKFDWLCSLQMLSRTGRCRTFGADADGFVPGEGVGAAVLKPLRAALADGDEVLGVVKGTAINHGGRTNGYTVPNPAAQAKAVSAALADGGVDPATVGYVEAHGTGTALGDPVEIAGLTRAFTGAPSGGCAIGSVKTNIGHLESAAGIAGLTKVLLQFEHGTLVPTMHARKPNPRIDFAATPFAVQHDAADWLAPTGGPRRAGVSAFGAGGANAHVVLQEAPPLNTARGPADGAHLVVVSARDRERLVEHCANLSASIRDRAEVLRVSEIAYQLQVRREPQSERLALLAGDPVELADRLAAFAAGGRPEGEHWVTVRDRAARTDVREQLPRALASRDWAALARAWVAGADVPWESLHDVPLRHVRLPGYPFARERYPLPEIPAGETGEHPWVRERSGDGVVVEFTGEEPELAQHRVAGIPVFPAAGCVELIRAAARLDVAAGRVIRLRDNVWSAPVAVDRPRTLRVSLLAGGYEVTSEEGTVHVTGKVDTVTEVDVPPLDVASVRARCTTTVTGQRLYERTRDRSLDLGPFYQGVERLHCNDDEALAELRVPGGDPRCALHPGLLDSAFQAVLWLVGQRFDRLFLPFSIGSVEVLGPLPDRAVAHVELRTAAPDGCKVRVRLADESGAVVVRVLDFWVRPWSGDATRTGPMWTGFRPEWIEEEPGAAGGARSVLVLAPTPEAGTRLTGELAARAGTPPRSAVAVPDHETDFGALLRDEGPVDTVVFAWPRSERGDVAAQLADGLRPLFRLVRALLRAEDKGPVRLVCAIPDRTPAYQALGGLLRTVTRESPRISHVLVAGAAPEQIAAEALGPVEGAEVRYRDGLRTVRRWRRADPTPAPRQVVRRDGVYLVTGGAGGLGGHVARWLAETVGARVMLAGRSPEDERVAAVRDLVLAAGGRAHYVRADVSTADGAREAVRAARAEFGALHGVFHCAGVLRDGFLAQQDLQRVHEVIAAKVFGAVHLDVAVREHPLDFLCLFSSVASAVGSAGQVGYAYANAFLDAFAEFRTERTIAVAWPLWADGGMSVDPEVAESLRVTFGLRPLATETGLDALSVALGGEERALLVAPGDGATLARVLAGPSTVAPAVAVPGDFGSAVRQVLRAEIARITELDPARIQNDQPIGDYGFDSLSFTQLANQLVKRLGVDLTPALFFEHTTVDEITDHLAEAHGTHLAVRLAPEHPAPSRPACAAERPRPAPVDEPIAIVGMHGMLPGSADLSEFWRNLDAGRDLVTEIPSDRWDWREYYGPVAGPGRTNSRWGGFLPEVDVFDAAFFGISPREAQLMDPQQRLFLETAYKAVEEAGYRPSDLAKGRTGLFVGAASHDYYDLLREAGVPVEAFTSTGMFHAILANRVSYLLDLTGPSFPIDTACSSSLVALRAAVESIRAGGCDTAIVGAVNLLLSPTIYISFARAGMLSPTGRCRTFDAGADGYVRAEGVGALVLKPLAAAERDGDHVHAVILGSVVNHGGKVNTLTTPNPKAQTELIVRAFDEAGVDPATVGYFELHGTGTALGDPVEVNAVKRAIGQMRDRAGVPVTEPTVLIGSVKSNIGHPEAVAGLAGIFKVVLSMKHGRIPGNLHLGELNPQIRLAGSPLRIVDRTMPWPRPTAADGTEQPRRAGVSSFGFGGVNGHVLLEEHVAAPADPTPSREQVFVLSARDEDRLRDYAAALADAVAPTDPVASSPEQPGADLIAEVATLLGVEPSDVPWDEPLADLGLSHRHAVRLADRMAAAGLSDVDTALLPTLTVAQLSVSGTAARTQAQTGPCPAGDLADVAYTLQVGREPMPHRLAVVTDSAAELARELSTFAATGVPGARTRIGVADERRDPVTTDDLWESARQWVTGAVPDWTVVDGARRPRRLSLPTYPFARDRHWIPGSSAAEPDPLVLGPGTEDGDATVYRATLSTSDRVVDEHRVHGVPVLAGVVQVELAAAAMAAHRRAAHRVTRVSWLRPLVVRGATCEVLIRLTEHADGIAYEIHAADGTVCSTGLWVHGDGPAATPAPHDLDAIRRRCRREYGQAEIYRLFDDADIAYGPVFRGLTDAVTGNGELLARFTTEVALPQRMTFHPTALDAALQAITVLTGTRRGTTRLPFAVEEIELLAPVPTTGFVHLVAGGGDGHDITVLDETGRPCVVLHQVTVRPEQHGFFYRPHWRLADASDAEPVRGPVLIAHSACSAELADALAARHDGQVHRISAAEIAGPGLPARLRGLGDVRHVWFLALAGEGARLLFRLIRGLVDADLVQQVRSVRSVTSGAQDALGRRVTEPVAAGLIGLTKSLAKEYPRIAVSCVDIAPAAAGWDRTAAALLAEPAHQGNREVALVGERRLVRLLRPVRLPAPARPVFRHGGSYVIVGGASGIGLALAEHLAANFSARTFLVGRGRPGERIEQALRRLAGLGGAATYHQADVTDPEAMRAVAAKARTHGPLHGVVHAAMVLCDGIVERLSHEDFEAVLAPKGEGTRVLGEVFATEPLDFLLVLSSVQSYTGAAGQSNYAAASTEQDAHVRRLATSLPFPVQSVNFGPWAKVGRVADRYESLAARGYRPIEPAEGIAAIEQVLASGERGLVALRADQPVLDAIGVEAVPVTTVTGSVPAHQDDRAEREALDDFIGDALWHLVGELGLVTRPHERYRTADLMDRLGALPRSRGLVEELVRILVRRGLLVRDGQEILTSASPRPTRPDPAALRTRFPNLNARLDLVLRCLDALPSVLTGARSAVEVLFPGGSSAPVAAIYRGESLVDYCNSLVARQVARAGQHPRVLEIGAGTGSTTEAVLAALATSVRYDVTDVSRGLLQQAQARLARPGVRFRVLDIERPAAEQGFAGERYDVVVAGNVLHATRDLDAALGEVRGLLAPGGCVVLTEVTVVQPFHTVTFGLLDGWWNFDDETRRLPGSPLLDPHMWRDRLEAAGFRDVAILGEPAVPGVLPQRVMVATVDPDQAAVVPHPSQQPREGQIRAIVTERVAGCLGVPVVDLRPDTDLSDVGVDSIVAVELTNQLNQALGIVMRTIMIFERPTVEALTAYIVEEFGDRLALGPARRAGEVPASGAGAVVAGEVEQRPSLGVGEAGFRSSGSAGVGQGEQRPLSGGARDESPSSSLVGARAVLFERPGAARDLRIVPIEPVAPGPGEIEIQVRAFPINFSDSLVAKGLYPMMPDFPVTPGVELSGTVRRVGEGVRRFAPGDEVMALTRPTMGGQASVVVTGEDFAVAKPTNVSHEAACGFLVPFLAVYLAFERAGVRPGERVFVPAAAGTLGLVAVRLAQQAGAKVIATAGGADKVAHLAGLGVQDAIDHRGRDVVGEVLRRTGGADVVINFVAGETAGQGIDVLAPDGRYVELAVLGLQSSSGPDLSRLVNNQSFHSLNTKKFFLRHPERREELLRTAAEHLAAGGFASAPAHVLPFARVTEAYAIKEDRGLVGRVVVTMAGHDESVGRRLRELLVREFGEHAALADAEIERLTDRLDGK